MGNQKVEQENTLAIAINHREVNQSNSRGKGANKPVVCAAVVVNARRSRVSPGSGIEAARQKGKVVRYQGTTRFAPSGNSIPRNA